MSECTAWNAKCKLARVKNAQARTGMGNHAQVGGQNCNNGQGLALQHQAAQRGAGENNQNQNGHKNANSVKAAHPCCTNVRVVGISAITALAPRITLNRDR